MDPINHFANITHRPPPTFDSLPSEVKLMVFTHVFSGQQVNLRCACSRDKICVWHQLAFRRDSEIIAPRLVCKAWNDFINYFQVMISNIEICAKNPKAMSFGLAKRRNTFGPRMDCIRTLRITETVPWLETYHPLLRPLCRLIEDSRLQRLRRVVFRGKLCVVHGKRVATAVSSGHGETLPSPGSKEITQVVNALCPFWGHGLIGQGPRPQSKYLMTPIRKLNHAYEARKSCSRQFLIAAERSGIAVEMEISKLEFYQVRLSFWRLFEVPEPPMSAADLEQLMARPDDWAGRFSTKDWKIRIREKRGMSQVIVVDQEKPFWLHE